MFYLGGSYDHNIFFGESFVSTITENAWIADSTSEFRAGVYHLRHILHGHTGVWYFGSRLYCDIGGTHGYTNWLCHYSFSGAFIGTGGLWVEVRQPFPTVPPAVGVWSLGLFYLTDHVLPHYGSRLFVICLNPVRRCLLVPLRLVVLHRWVGLRTFGSRLRCLMLQVSLLLLGYQFIRPLSCTISIFMALARL